MDNLIRPGGLFYINVHEKTAMTKGEGKTEHKSRSQVLVNSSGSVKCGKHSIPQLALMVTRFYRIMIGSNILPLKQVQIASALVFSFS